MHEDWLLFIGMRYAWKFHACEKASMLFEFQAVCWSLPQKGQSPTFRSWHDNWFIFCWAILNQQFECRFGIIYAARCTSNMVNFSSASKYLTYFGSWNHVMVQVSSHRFYAVSPPAIMFGTAFFPKQKPPKKFSWNKIRKPCTSFIPLTFIQKSWCVIT